MLSRAKLNLIKETILKDDGFIALMDQCVKYSGKEKGHSFASPVEDEIRKILVDKLGAKKESRSRAHADLSLEGYRLNIKFGAPQLTKNGQPKYGQPNMCSMKRVVKDFSNEAIIDSYYIIKVNMNVEGGSGYSLSIFDMFDYIDYLTWNAGTGQIMLKEREFYKDYNSFVPNYSISQKKEKMKLLYNKGLLEHVFLRMKDSINAEENPIYKDELKKSASIWSNVLEGKNV